MRSSCFVSPSTWQLVLMAHLILTNSMPALFTSPPPSSNPIWNFLHYCGNWTPVSKFSHSSSDITSHQNLQNILGGGADWHLKQCYTVKRSCTNKKQSGKRKWHGSDPTLCIARLHHQQQKPCFHVHRHEKVTSLLLAATEHQQGPHNPMID